MVRSPSWTKPASPGGCLADDASNGIGQRVRPEMSGKFTDYYGALGIPPDASFAQVRQAYRLLAREHHPDVASDKQHAEETFKEIKEAYEVLADPAKRKRYDELGPNWWEGAQFGPASGAGWSRVSTGRRPLAEECDFQVTGTGFGELFRRLFGSGNRLDGSGSGQQGRLVATGRGKDIEGEILVSLEEARQGSTRKVTVRRSRPCTLCCATGRLGPCRCDLCRGTGRTVKTQTYKVNIPADVTDGQCLRLTERRGPRPGDGAAGDVVLRVRLAKSRDPIAGDQGLHAPEHSNREQARQKLEAAASQLQLLHVRVASLEQECAALAARLAETRQSRATPQTSLSALQKELRAQQRLIQQEQARRQALERQLRQLTNRQVAFETRLQEAKGLPGDANHSSSEPSESAQVQLELQLPGLPAARQKLESKNQEAAPAKPLRRPSGLKPGHKARPAIRRSTLPSPTRRSKPSGSPSRTEAAPGRKRFGSKSPAQHKRPRRLRSEPTQLYRRRAARLPRRRPDRWPGALAPAGAVKPRPSTAPNRLEPPSAARKSWWRLWAAKT